MYEGESGGGMSGNSDLVYVVLIYVSVYAGAAMVIFRCAL